MLVLAPITLAADAGNGAGDSGDKGPKQGIMKGFVVRVEEKKLVFKDKAGPEVTVATTDATEVTLDGKPAKLSDLKAGLFVQVLSANDTADRIIARTPKPKPK
jgi:hypothetical protein